MSIRKTVKVKIWGIVQGVGFRPFVAKLADRYGIKGEILNIGGLVDIILTDTQDRIDDFVKTLIAEKTLPAEIVHIKIEELEHREFSSFTIQDSDNGDDEAAMIPADMSICPACLAELKDETNPRYMHPFISCMTCGPRYTIIDRIPYDRENTAMKEFPMCDFCHKEYIDRHDRRYHAQTISCHDCGPMLKYILTEKKSETKGAQSVGMIGIKADEKVMDRAVQPVFAASSLINNGRIIALKCVGGYNFVCSPFNEAAVKNLRRLKIREEKPFAVMFRDLDQIREYCHVSHEEEALLISNAKPIVLLERKQPDTGLKKIINNNASEQEPDQAEIAEEKNATEKKEICREVYKTSRYIGAFLPSMGVQHMLIDICGPLIMTSANLSDMPIIKDDEGMFEIQKTMDLKHYGEKLLAGVFYNTREIRVRLDDSVIRVIDSQPQMVRRSKGYSPIPLYISNTLSKKDMILAVGGQLKSSFSLSKGPFAYVSQYFGDLSEREACSIFEENVDRMESLFRIQPKLIVSDLHPLYFTTKYAEQYAKKHEIELLKVQHHHAHVASVMAEHDLNETVIGVSFDGTGYGSDGAVWGGEFLVCSGMEFTRAAHLEYISMIGGDSSIKEGWKSALSYVHHYRKQNELMGTQYDLKEPEDQRWPAVKAGLENHINTIESSSMGRLFDAIAAFTGIHDVNRYEGECAAMLENAAAEAETEGLDPWNMNFTVTQKAAGQINEILISARSIFIRIEEGLLKGVDKRRLALSFHYAAADLILKICTGIRRQYGLDIIALTGGVFQNKVLTERTIALLRKEKFQVYCNISVGPNDGGICLGQNLIGMKYLTTKQHNVNIDIT
ncbi:MAG: carbamoyltransferase HypF [Eubacteriales bacterium]|nr:carbamoyltransferase HypF [Eubacteriales bacterium]MDD3199305.1 carbamoyltransferase HypF [Eubacteriales bacterium]MDD4121304.1 carbamoyltransferase HypF [Eubacteriales bacterium]MDD4629435.1 carbamoyltransferase HypF [Eubacteriales bacterium]